jgi:hypothetical protein
LCGARVFERRPRALSELISVVLVGGYLGRQVLDEHDLGSHIAKLRLGPQLGACALLWSLKCISRPC